MTTKIDEWAIFSAAVMDHIDEYVVPQYGDYPDEMIEEFNLRDIQKQLGRYVKRIEFSSRGIEDSIVDSLKIAHYACYLHTKLKEIENENNLKSK